MLVLAELIVCSTRGFACILVKWFWPMEISLSFTYGSPEASCNKRADTYLGRRSASLMKEFWTLCIFVMTVSTRKEGIWNFRPLVCEHRFCSQTKTIRDRNCTACFSLANIFNQSINKSFGAKLQSEVTGGFTQVRIGNLIKPISNELCNFDPPSARRLF